MKKKFIFTFSLIALSIIFACSYSFAANNIGQEAVDGVRNFVGGAENVIENTANGVISGVRNITGDTENTLSHNDNMGAMNNRNNNPTEDYTATRTATRTATTDNNSLMGISSTMWTWIIMAILGVALIALVWYYSKQFSGNYNSHNDD